MIHDDPAVVNEQFAYILSATLHVHLDCLTNAEPEDRPVLRLWLPAVCAHLCDDYQDLLDPRNPAMGIETMGTIETICDFYHQQHFTHNV